MDNEERKMLFDAAVKDIIEVNDEHCKKDLGMKLTTKEVYMCALSVSFALEGAIALDNEMSNSFVDVIALTLERVLGAIGSNLVVPKKEDMN